MGEFVLCVDVGNSRSKFGLFPLPAGRVLTDLPECASVIAVRHSQPLPWNEVHSELSARVGHAPAGFIAGSNPAGIATLLASWPSDWPEPKLIDTIAKFPESLQLNVPKNAGMDRILKAVACNVVRPQGRPALVIDTGTATTVDSISPEGAFEGGAILPGFELCARALHQYTALLPFITVDELIEESHEPLGQGTREALRSGLLWGQVGAIKELAARLSQRWSTEPFLMLTGGGSPLAAPHFPKAIWKPYLSLQGLSVVAALLRDPTS